MFQAYLTKAGLYNVLIRVGVFTKVYGCKYVVMLAEAAM